MSQQTMGKVSLRSRRHQRVRQKVVGTALRPRLSVFRSNKNIYAQLIDDAKGKTLLAVTPTGLKVAKSALSRKRAVAYQLGMTLAAKALAKKIKQVVFDRGGYRYAGRVQALAEGARAGGLNF